MSNVRRSRKDANSVGRGTKKGSKRVYVEPIFVAKSIVSLATIVVKIMVDRARRGISTGGVR